uniref:beta strand repeat-containing protein n=1 Tax=Aquimarina latercula TaxID=987 RepID=UPI000556D3EA
MKTILLKILCPFALGLISSICYSQVGTNFSEPTAVSAVYSDPNTTTHQLSNNVSQPTVEYVFGTNGSTELGFKTRFIATRTGTSGSSGLSDGDLIGVVPGTTFQNGAPSTTGAAGFLIGSGNVFMIEDPDGTIQIEFDEVDLSSTINPQLSLKYGIRSATYENTDGANDRFFVALQVDGNPNFVTIVDSDGDGTEGGNNATGNDIDGQLTEGSEQTINFSLVPYIGSKVKLIIEADFNAASEEVAIDDIVFSEGSIATSNNAPIATAPSAPTVLEDAINVALADNILVADTDGDDQTVTFTITGGTVTLGTAGITFGGSGNGSASFTAAGTLANINAALDAATFTPTPNLNGTNAGTISFTTNDGTDTSSPASVTFDITAVNDEPSFTAGANETINEDAGAQTVNGWATAIDDGDADATQTLTFTVTDDNNALFSVQPAINATGNLTYTPATNANGSATVDVVLSDNGGTANGGDDTFATQQFIITVNAVNDEPSFTAGANESINEDAGAQTVNGWATAIDDGDADATQTLTFTVTNDNNALFSAQPAIDATGNLTYTPAANANGSATVSVVLSDNGGTANGGDDTFATQQFTITINAVNDEPSFTAGANESINEDAGAQTVNGWATAIDDGDADATQTLTFTVTNDNNALFSAQPAIDATGNLTYTPATNANGSATVDVVLSDNGGTANGGDDTFATQQFTITVNAVNDEPSFTAGANETINEDAGAQTVNGWATAIDDGDADATQTLTFTVTNDNNALFSAQPAIDATGNLTYTTAADANGTATVDVVLSDDGGTANGGDDTF